MWTGFPPKNQSQPPFRIDPFTRALIFDIDGTLVDTLPVHFETWQHTLRELHEYELSWAEFSKVLGFGKFEIVQKFSALIGKELDYRLHKDVQEEKYAHAVRDAALISPVVELLKKYASKLPICLATAESRQVAELNISVSGVEGYYDCLLAAEDVQRRKPDPEIYLKAAEILDVPPRLCQVFEDSEAGILAAKGAQMKVCDVSSFAPSNAAYSTRN